MIDKSDYRNTVIPDELEDVVNNAISEGKRLQKKNKVINIFSKMGGAAAVFIVVFIVALNISPSVAYAAYQIPVIRDLCRIVSFREYHFEDDIKYIDVKIPKIENTGKSDLEKRVNLEIQKKIDDCIAENEEVAKDYYNAFIETGGKPEDFTPVGITVDYDIKCINEKYASFVISQYETAFNAYNHEFYYNIDLESGRVLTLKDLYGNDYKEITAKSIENTISDWTDEQREMLFEDISFVDLIDENTDFYINQNDDIVVVFGRYEIANGAAGTLEFTIQTALTGEEDS